MKQPPLQNENDEKVFNADKLKKMDVVQSYMLGHNFTVNQTNCSGRPPAIGEEHEVTSVDGRMSTHSSVSGKSERSTATPRRTDVDLGYEPEGSDSPFPSYERWKLSLHNLMQDSDGLNEFKSFLEESGQESILDFWFAMKGFRNFGLKSNTHHSGNSSAASSTCGSMSNRNIVAQNMDIDTIQKRTKLARVIFKKFLGKQASFSMSGIIKEPTRSYICQQIKTADKTQGVESDLFVQAQTEIELNIESNHYKKFLESEKFLAYTSQCDNASPKPGNPVPAESQKDIINKPVDQFQPQALGSKYLPSIKEDGVWQPAKGRTDSLREIAIRRAADRKFDAGSDMSSKESYSDTNNAAFPYFTPSYYFVPPASAIGSDQASKSSDATSDTLSFTDTSSVDGPSFNMSGTVRKRVIKSQVRQNKSTGLPDCNHVPRTSRCPNIPMLAANDPQAFFEQLKIKLDRVIEERRVQRIEAARVRHAANQKKAAVAAVAQRVIRENEEDMDQMMESHLARALQSPGGRCSPPIPPNSHRRVPHPHPNFHAPGTHPGLPTDPRFKPTTNPGHPSAAKTSSLARRPQDEKLGVGLVPGMPQNEVPDVDTPVNPVDKNQMITAWIGQMAPPVRSKRSLKLRKSVEPSVATVPEEEPSIVHPVQSTGLTRNGFAHPRMQPLAQDLSMPILDQPDASTTIEEVKRRLIEETDGSSDSDILKLGSSTGGIGGSDSIVPNLSHDEHHHHSDTDSSTETATFANTTHQHQQQQTPNAAPSDTTVLFYLPREEFPYKMRLPHSPLTLGHLKGALPRRVSYRYYFKELSQSLGKPTYFEYTKDDEILPLFDGIVLAKLESKEP